MSETLICLGATYKDRRGREYELLHVGVDERTKRWVAVYRRIHYGDGAVSRMAAETVWVRPLAEFRERFTFVPNPWDEQFDIEPEPAALPAEGRD